MHHIFVSSIKSEMTNGNVRLPSALQIGQSQLLLLHIQSHLHSYRKPSMRCTVQLCHPKIQVFLLYPINWTKPYKREKYNCTFVTLATFFTSITWTSYPCEKNNDMISDKKKTISIFFSHDNNFSNRLRKKVYANIHRCRRKENFFTTYQIKCIKTL